MFALKKAKIHFPQGTDQMGISWGISSYFWEIFLAHRA